MSIEKNAIEKPPYSRRLSMCKRGISELLIKIINSQSVRLVYSFKNYIATTI